MWRGSLRLLFELICERYERRSLLITCNHPFQEWDQIFEDKKMAIAAVDRLVHHATLIDIQAESFRKREAEARSGSQREKNNCRRQESDS